MVAPAIILGLLGTGIGAVGDILGGGAEKKAANAQAANIEYNADQTERQAFQALTASKGQAADIYGNAGRVTSQNAVFGAASGLDLGIGVPGDLFDATNYLSEFDATRVRRSGRYAYQAGMDEAGNMRTQAKQIREAGKTAQTMGWVKGASTLVSGGVNAWNTYKNLGSPMKQAKLPIQGVPIPGGVPMPA